MIDNLSLMGSFDDDSEFIPLLSTEDEERMMKTEIPPDLPILPIRNMVLFPGVVIPISAGRDKAINLLQDAQKNKSYIGVVAQENLNADDPTPEDIFSVGTVARIIKLLKMPDGSSTAIIQGVKRFHLDEITLEDPYFMGSLTVLEDKKPSPKNKEFQGIIDNIIQVGLDIIDRNHMIPSEAALALKNIDSPFFLVNFVASNLNLNSQDKQQLLEISDLKKRAKETLRLMYVELQRLEVQNEVQSKVRTDMDKQQREYFLQQQMRTIQEELGDLSYEEEFDEFQKRAEKKKWSKEIAETFEKELKRLRRMNPQVPEHSVQRNYLEFMLDLPWGDVTDDKIDLKRAEKILNRDHFGLEDIKERILEYLAVLKLKNDMKSPIILLHGPPGVGKTSLGKSIAESLNREYVRMSLGGLHDESEIRGHRKTYIGAMPGRILKSIKQAGSSNPVFVLDEIDKMGNSAHGDPSSAMLEVLDPEQNTTFYDNYLELGYDLSKVFFIATANSLNSIHPALRDRMEVVHISGYTIEEKVEIAKKHLIPKQLESHGLNSKQLTFPKAVIEFIVAAYTRESGVRTLEKRIAKVIRNVAKKVAMEEEYAVKLTKDQVSVVLGPPRELDKMENHKIPGVATGLAWTSVGGDILFIESLLSEGKGDLSLTGSLGDVMKESAKIALEYIKAHHEKWGIDSKVFETHKIHIHVPEGAVKKDGPSAGITMLSAMLSAFTGKVVNPKIAMTGEITLRGKVLPVGGIKEKILAAKRANITEIILCEDNRKDVEEIKEEYLKGLTFHYVKDMDKVPDIAFG